jgi:thioredoxin reductase (NADPH)
MSEIFDVAVIGAGGAGQMAMLRAALNHLNTVVFMGDGETSKKSRATWVMEVDNIPGMFDKKRPISATAREVIQFIEKNDDLTRFLTTIKKAVSSVKKDGDVFELMAGDETFKARFVVLCTGTMDVQPVINGSIQPILPFANKGDALYCIRCDGHKVVGHNCAVIGSGASAGWISIMLKERYDLPKITILTHGKTFEADDKVKGLLEKYEIEVIEGAIDEVLGDPKIALKGFKVGNQKIDVTKCFIALGSITYNKFAKDLGAELSPDEHVVVNPRGKTSVPGLYVAGDLAEGKKKQVYTAWDLAVDAVDSIDEKIRVLKRG